eukprot:1194717-Prorocentrum_minimum.AAC.3
MSLSFRKHARAGRSNCQRARKSLRKHSPTRENRREQTKPKRQLGTKCQLRATTFILRSLFLSSKRDETRSLSETYFSKKRGRRRQCCSTFLTNVEKHRRRLPLLRKISLKMAFKSNRSPIRNAGGIRKAGHTQLPEGPASVTLPSHSRTEKSGSLTWKVQSWKVWPAEVTKGRAQVSPLVVSMSATGPQ